LWKLLFGDFDVGIAIVCFEEIVVQWLMLFDEVVFQIERFTLIFYRQEVNFHCFGEHFLFSERGGRKILSDSLLKVFGFSDIENDVFPVFEEVDSTILWYFGNIGRKHL